MPNKIIRTICIFTDNPTDTDVSRLYEVEKILIANGFQVQTKRICAKNEEFGALENKLSDETITLGLGAKDFDLANSQIERFYNSRDFFHIECSDLPLELKHVKILFDIIKNKPSKTFNFAYVFNNAKSSPYMPSASYEKNGFALGLQSTDLAENAQSLQEWFTSMKDVWNEINTLFATEPDFLGIDTSVAPLFEENSSLIHLIKRLYGSFSATVTTNIYTQITGFIKGNNVSNVGLCGLMLPALEDFELAREYEAGNFTLERCIFLSLHSGLGIDTYPIGIDEKPERVLEVLKLMQALSNKYNKPLSARFVSDGVAKIGEMSDFKNRYLHDVILRSL